MSFKYKHGFCILRCQPFHIGHDRLINQMMKECEFGTVLIGSAQESGTYSNPLPYFTRKKLIQNVWRKKEDYARLQIIPVKDTTTLPWGFHVLETIKKELPEREKPDDQTIFTLPFVRRKTISREMMVVTVRIVARAAAVPSDIRTTS